MNIENLDFKNPRFSNIRVSIFTYSEYRKDVCQKSEIFKHLASEYRKLGFQKIRDFQTSVFSIFTYSEYQRDFRTSVLGEYRKHGFIKAGEKKSAISEKSAFSTWPEVQYYPGTKKLILCKQADPFSYKCTKKDRTETPQVCIIYERKP